MKKVINVVLACAFSGLICYSLTLTVLLFQNKPNQYPTPRPADYVPSLVKGDKIIWDGKYGFVEKHVGHGVMFITYQDFDGSICRGLVSDRDLEKR